MAKCSFCGIDIPKGTGKMFVKLDGKIFYFCTSKCEKNTLKMKRKPHTTGWTHSFHDKKKPKTTVKSKKKDNNA